jgi:hypothetical protein
MEMVKQPSRFTFDTAKDLAEMIDQRATQEGISVSEYIREAIILELWFSGDLEAMKFVAGRVGKRVKAALLDKLAGVDLKERLDALDVG